MNGKCFFFPLEGRHSHSWWGHTRQKPTDKNCRENMSCTHSYYTAHEHPQRDYEAAVWNPCSGVAYTLKSSLCGPVAKPLNSSTRLIPPWTLAYRYIPCKIGHSFCSYAQLIWPCDFCSTRCMHVGKSQENGGGLGLIFFRSDDFARGRLADFCLLQCETCSFFIRGFLLRLQKNIYCFSHHSYTCCSNTALHLVHLKTSEAHELNLIKTAKATRLNCIHAKSNTKAWWVIQL